MNQKLSLKKLKGIKPKGVKVKPSSKLQSMIELEKKVVDRYGKLEYEFPTSSALSCEFKEESYGNLYRRFEPEFEKSNFSKQDLVNYVNYCFADDSYDTPSELIVRGFYSGALLEYISKQAKQRDEYLCLEINGENNSFDHLFAFARNPCDLFLENATGRKICERFGFHSGFNNLALFNISGDNIGHVLGANSEKGGNIILSNISGNMLFEGALVGTNINSLTASDIKGYCFSQGANLFDLDLIILKNVLDVAGLSFYSTEADVVCFENVSSKDLISAENDFRIFRESYIHLLLSEIICPEHLGQPSFTAQGTTFVELQSGQRFRKLGTTSESPIRPPP